MLCGSRVISLALPQTNEYDCRDQRQGGHQHRERGAEARLILLEGYLVRVSAEYLAGMSRSPSCHYEDVVEDGETPYEGDGRYQRDHRGELRDDDVPGPLEPVGPVDLGRLHLAHVYVLQGSKEDYYDQPRGPRDGRDQDRIQRGVRVPEPAAAELFEPNAVEELVQRAEQGMEDPLPHDGHDHQRKDKRKEVDRPEEEGTAGSAPQEERQEQPEDDRRDRSDDHPDDVVVERLPDGLIPQHPRVVRQPHEVFGDRGAVPVRETEVDRVEEGIEHEDQVDGQSGRDKQDRVVHLLPPERWHVGFALGLHSASSLLLRRYLPLLLRRCPGILQRRRLLRGRPRPVQNFLEAGEHDLVEVRRGQDVDVVTEGAGLGRFRQVVENLFEQRGNVEPLRVHRVRGDRVERLHDQAGGVFLLVVVYERDSTLGVLRFFGYERASTHPGRRRDPGSVYRREREETDFEVPNRLDDLRYEPGAGDVHRGLAGVEQCVGIVVADGVYAIRVVAALRELPEEEVDGLLDLRGVPAFIPVEDVVQSFPAQHVADSDAEKVPGGPLLRIPKPERNLPLPFEFVGHRPEIVDGLWLLGHEILVVVDDQFFDLVRNAVSGPTVGGPLLGPVVDLPAVLLVGLLQRIKEPRFCQHAAETGAGVVAEVVGWLFGTQSGLYDLADIVWWYRLAFHGVFRVLVLEPVD